MRLGVQGEGIGFWVGFRVQGLECYGYQCMV